MIAINYNKCQRDGVKPHLYDRSRFHGTSVMRTITEILISSSQGRINQLYCGTESAPTPHQVTEINSISLSSQYVPHMTSGCKTNDFIHGISQILKMTNYAIRDDFLKLQWCTIIPIHSNTRIVNYTREFHGAPAVLKHETNIKMLHALRILNSEINNNVLQNPHRILSRENGNIYVMA